MNVHLNNTLVHFYNQKQKKFIPHIIVHLPHSVWVYSVSRKKWDP